MSEDGDKRARFEAALEHRRVAAKRGGFSLAAFYVERQRDGEAAAPLPHVELREGLPEVETTGVGVCPPIEVDPADEDVS
jgi:hypothetical protein